MVHPAQQDFGDVLSRAESLYYEAKFNDAIQLLTPFDDSLKAEPGRVKERVSVNLQLALGYVALNEFDKAKSHFIEMCTLDAECSIKADQYPPKVRTLFEDARNQARRDAAERAYQDGLEADKRNDLAESVRKFRDARRLNPEHPIAPQYVTLSEAKLRVGIDQKLLDWRKNFENGDLTQAATIYKQLLSMNVDGMATKAIDQIQFDYRKSLTASLDSWNRACQSGDTVGMARVRTEASAKMPDVSTGQDVLAQMNTCTVKPCVSLDPQTAILRVKTSAKPVLPPQLERTLRGAPAQAVQVDARIEQNGDVAVLSTRGENPAINDAVRVAVEKWKFSPAIVENEARCVRTVFPIVITSGMEASQ